MSRKWDGLLKTVSMLLRGTRPEDVGDLVEMIMRAESRQIVLTEVEKMRDKTEEIARRVVREEIGKTARTAGGVDRLQERVAMVEADRDRAIKRAEKFERSYRLAKKNQDDAEADARAQSRLRDKVQDKVASIRRRAQKAEKRLDAIKWAFDITDGEAKP